MSLLLQASIVLEENDQLGLMIRGGDEFGLGIFVTGVLHNSAAWKLGLKVSVRVHVHGIPKIVPIFQPIQR